MSARDQRLIRVAVPSEAPGGLDAGRSGQFARSPFFTLVDVYDGTVVAVSAVANEIDGGASRLAPVLTLSEHSADAVIVAGIDFRLLLDCVQTGIRVFAGADEPDVRTVIDAFLQSELLPVGQEATRAH